MSGNLRVAIFAVCALASACGSPSRPSSPRYAGQWSGMTTQGQPIDFTISSEESVTTISLGHSFNGCSGSQTFSNLRLAIMPQVECIPGPCSASVTSYRAFSYSSGSPIEGQSTDIRAVFMPLERAEGTANFRNVPGCGTAMGVAWSAARR